MSNLEEKDVNVLTQEEFDEEIVKALRNNRIFIKFTDVIVKDVEIKFIYKALIGINFQNCRIGSISCDYFTLYHMILGIKFYNCDIVDYEKVEGISKYDITDCTFIKPVPFVCPEEGEFIGYKKCEHSDKKEGYYEHCIVKLLVPADAKRSSAFTNKCRCDKAKVLGIFDLDGNEIDYINRAYSCFDKKFTYRIGEWVYPNSFDDNRFKECSHGIHFFMTFEESREYVL